jgi:hypothetical protein
MLSVQCNPGISNIIISLQLWKHKRVKIQFLTGGKFKYSDTEFQHLHIPETLKFSAGS